MTLQSSGPISIANIVTEFGGVAPHSLNEYYRGGTYVPNISVNNNVPTSGTISLSNFYGASVTTPTTTVSFTMTCGVYSPGKGTSYNGYGTTTGTYGSMSPTSFRTYILSDFYYGPSPSGVGIYLYLLGDFNSVLVPSTLFNDIAIYSGSTFIVDLVQTSATFTATAGSGTVRSKGMWFWAGTSSAIPSSGTRTLNFTY